MVVGRNELKLRSLVGEIDNEECRLDIVVADVNDETQWERIGQSLTDAPEPSNLVFVNCAGVAHFGPFGEADFDAIREQISTNLYSPIMLTREILPAMLAAGGGQIVNILSIAATTTFAGAATYCASKAGLLSFSRAIAAEYRRQGIRVTNILPGATNTPIWGTDGRHPPLEKMLPADAIAQCVVQVVMSPADRNFDEIHLMPPDGIL